MSKDELKGLVNEKKSYSMGGFEKVGDNKFQVWLYHEEDGIEIFEKYNLELLSKRDDNPMILVINNEPHELYMDEIDKDNYRVKSRKWTRPHIVKILGRLTSTVQGKGPYIKTPQPTEPPRPSLQTGVYEKPGEVTAPMPGIIVVVKVKRGDEVKLGQPLCILEAMKMENEITANKAGVVEEVTIQEGTSVRQRELMVKIK